MSQNATLKHSLPSPPRISLSIITSSVLWRPEILSPLHHLSLRAPPSVPFCPPLSSLPSPFYTPLLLSFLTSPLLPPVLPFFFLPTASSPFLPSPFIPHLPCLLITPYSSPLPSHDIYSTTPSNSHVLSFFLFNPLPFPSSSPLPPPSSSSFPYFPSPYHPILSTYTFSPLTPQFISSSSSFFTMLLLLPHPSPSPFPRP